LNPISSVSISDSFISLTSFELFNANKSVNSSALFKWLFFFSFPIHSLN
jgi:hypothetical protein